MPKIPNDDSHIPASNADATPEVVKPVRKAGAASGGKASKKLAPLFQEYYDRYYNSDYKLNWPMIKTAEKVGAYYSIDEVKVCLQYYFDNRSNHNIWDFLSQINDLYDLAQKEEESRLRLRELMANTKKQLEDYS